MGTLKKPESKADMTTDPAEIEAAMEGTEPAMSAPVVPVAGAPNPWEVMNRVALALEALSSRPAGEQSNTAIETLTQAVMRMADSNIKAAQMTVDESKKANRPSNQVVPNVSVFNRRGVLLDQRDPKNAGPFKPPLKCLMMIPWLAEWDSLNREEVQLLNLLEEGSYTILRTDRTKLQIDVQMTYRADRVTPSSLLMVHETGYNQDNFRLMPPMADMLRVMLKQHDPEIRKAAAAVLTDEEEEAFIEAGELTVSQ